MNTMITNGWVSLNDSHTFEAFKEMSDEEKRVYHFIDNRPFPISVKVRIYEKGKNIVIAEQIASWKFANNKFFVSRRFDTLATITPTRIFCADRVGSVLCALLGVTQKFRITKPLIRAMVMRGKSAYDEHAKKEYVALHISESNPKDDYTIGFKIEYDYRGEVSVLLDQCYKAYNKPVTEEQKSYAESLKHFVYNLIMIHQLEGECKY